MTQKAFPSQQVRLAIIPNGTGNDFYRNFKNPKSKLVEALKSNTTHTIDLGLVHYKNKTRIGKTYFINMLGFGFDVAVTKEANLLALKGFKSVLSYLYRMIKCVINYEKQTVHLEIDGNRFDFDKTFSICIANGKYHGGGVPQAQMQTSDERFNNSLA